MPTERSAKSDMRETASPDAAFDLILFDLDGTLVDTAPDIADAANDALRAAGLPALAEPQITNWIGFGTKALLAKVLDQAVALAGAQTPEAAPGAELLARVETEYQRSYARRCGQRSRLYPQARETLSALRACGVKLALLTNKETRYTDSVLAARGLAELFDLIVCGDTLARKKPDPAGLLHCLSSLGVAPGRALFVGDSSIDAATARNAGVAVWLLPHGYNMGRPLAECAPDRIIADLSQLQDR